MKYWLKSIKSKNGFSKSSYKYVRSTCNAEYCSASCINWARDIQNELHRWVWENTKESQQFISLAVYSF